MKKSFDKMNYEELNEKYEFDSFFEIYGHNDIYTKKRLEDFKEGGFDYLYEQLRLDRSKVYSIPVDKSDFTFACIFLHMILEAEVREILPVADKNNELDVLEIFRGYKNLFIMNIHNDKIQKVINLLIEDNRSKTYLNQAELRIRMKPEIAAWAVKRQN